MSLTITPEIEALWRAWNRRNARARYEAYDYELRNLPSLALVSAAVERGRTNQEIAERLGCAAYAVQRARRRLRDQEAA